MCMCGKPTRNGEMGYSWDGKSVGVRPPNAPALNESDTVVFDEPGRCGGGIDAHCHHFVVVKNKFAGTVLRVRHGGGDEELRLSNPKIVGKALLELNSDDRYWVLHAIYQAANDAGEAARLKESARWYTAAAEKRIKTRKRRNSSTVTVSITPKEVHV